jgi:RimJ/RimL family protein N-acetyltransferase
VDELRTPRLLLRRWRPEDAVPLAAINGDPEVMRFIAGGRTLVRGESDALLERLKREWEARGYGLWAVEELDAPGTLAGFCGLAVPAFLPAVLPAVEVGWRLAPAAWGRGIATEAAQAAIADGFHEHGMREILGIVDPRNARSLRVAEKLEMTPRADRVHPQTGRRVRVLGVAAP